MSCGFCRSFEGPEMNASRTFREQVDGVGIRLCNAFRWVTSLATRVQASFAAFVALISSIIASSGFVSLLCLGALRCFFGADTTVVRPLFFDYSSSVATADSNLKMPVEAGLSLPFPWISALWKQEERNGIQYDDVVDNSFNLTEQKAQKYYGNDLVKKAETAVFGDGQELSVEVTLQLPTDYHELFQINCELLTSNGRLIARSAHPYLPKPRAPLWRILRALLRGPFFFVGLYDDSQEIRVQLYSRYIDKKTSPLFRIQIHLKSRDTSAGGLAPPPVYSAQLRVKPRLGLLRAIVSWLRPSLGFTLFLGMIASSVAILGSFTTICALIVAYVLFKLGRRANIPQPVQDAYDDQATRNLLHVPPYLALKAAPIELDSELRDLNHSRWSESSCSKLNDHDEVERETMLSDSTEPFSLVKKDM